LRASPRSPPVPVESAGCRGHVGAFRFSVRCERGSPMSAKPATRPARPQFSSGPCAKRPGWSLSALGDAALGRSHRAKVGKDKLAGVIERSKAVLGMPKDWRLGIVAGSDTGAMEMAMWSMLGARGIDMLAWESFGDGWVTDVTKQLKLDQIGRASCRER